jgi:hypothetical protein
VTIRLRIWALLLGRTWALEDGYDYLDYLEDRDIVVQLVWRRGHAMSEGNVRVDRAVCRAMTEQFGSSGAESVGRYGSLWRRERIRWRSGIVG